MKLRRRLRWVAWVALLPVGILILLFAQPLYRHHYDDRGFGTFHGFAGGSFTSQEGFLFVRFEGHTKPEWRWFRPSNYRYTDLDFEWDAGHTSGSGNLNLPSMTLTNSIGTVSIDREWFLRLNDQEDTATAYMDLLISARDGTLPRPRHHWHPFEDQIDGTLAHFSLGSRYPYVILVWAFLWIAASIYLLIRRTRTRQAEQEGADRPPTVAQLKAAGKSDSLQ